MLLVTGGAGFIGSNVVAALNDAGRADVTVCDMLGHDGKWRNLAKRQLADIVPPAELPDWLKGRRLDAVLHLGATHLCLVSRSVFADQDSGKLEKHLDHSDGHICNLTANSHGWI